MVKPMSGQDMVGLEPGSIIGWNPDFGSGSLGIVLQHFVYEGSGGSNLLTVLIHWDDFGRMPVHFDPHAKRLPYYRIIAPVLRST